MFLRPRIFVSVSVPASVVGLPSIAGVLESVTATDLRAYSLLVLSAVFYSLHVVRLGEESCYFAPKMALDAHAHARTCIHMCKMCFFVVVVRGDGMTFLVCFARYNCSCTFLLLLSHFN